MSDLINLMMKRREKMEKLCDKIAVVGIGETEYLRRSSREPRELVFEAIQKAVDDAGLAIKDIDGVTAGYRGAQWISHSDVAYNLGINYRFHGNMGDGSGSNSSSFHLAAMAITSGMADTVVTYYTNAYGSATSRLLGNYGPNLGSMKETFETPYSNNEQLVNFAQIATRYQHEYGISDEQFARQLGTIAVNQRRNAILNGKGVLKKPLNYEGYLKSPMISTPLRRDDCCVLSDGACAWIMTSAERAKDFPHKPVYVTGMGYGRTPMGGGDGFTQKAGGYFHKPHEGLSIDRALQMAGITRKDLDFAEIYDAFTIMLLLFFESLGFCEKGEGGAFAESGAIALEGDLPVNTHGGHLSHSYINGASHVVEAIKQLRGDAGPCQVKDARIGAVSVGTIWDNYVTIFRRD
jgi:acetyl-CoA acetyltransferase